MNTERIERFRHLCSAPDGRSHYREFDGVNGIEVMSLLCNDKQEEICRPRILHDAVNKGIVSHCIALVNLGASKEGWLEAQAVVEEGSVQFSTDISPSPSPFWSKAKCKPLDYSCGTELSARVVQAESSSQVVLQCTAFYPARPGVGLPDRVPHPFVLILEKDI